MCRLIGIAGTPPLPVREALEAFYPLCAEGCVKKGMGPGHMDGWGISGFSENRAVFFARRAESAAQSETEYRIAAERATKSSSPIVLAHFRKASAAPVEVANTHPFLFSDWMFAHNGTIFGHVGSFPLMSATPQGATDSERFFLWMHEEIHASTDPTRALIDLLKKAREGLVYSSLNFLMSDGKRLWAYREYGEKRLEKGETLKDREEYYTLYFAKLPSAVVFSSEPLKAIAPEWTALEQRTLAVVSTAAPIPQLTKI